MVCMTGLDDGERWGACCAGVDLCFYWLVYTSLCAQSMCLSISVLCVYVIADVLCLFFGVHVQ